ncbi:unnamed protein product [Orchesella dallaii]|uniref:Ubiquitin-like domain-containing protein n=1 Tax=Orchesella dallaii TaxID=48710 RepID=A0ABP1RDV9_9HEXA
MDYNAIVREKNAEIIGKVLISDLKNLPSKWAITYKDTKVSKDADLKYLLCDSKFPLSVYTDTSHWNRLIRVKTLTCKVIEFHTMSNITIEDLKTKIFKKEGIPNDQQRLLYCGKWLEDGRTIGDYTSERICTLELVLRLRGGGSFSSVDLESNHVKGQAAAAQNKWEGYNVGLNSRGTCSNESCISHLSKSGQTYSRNGYGNCVLKSETSPFLCTACSWSFIPTNFIVSSARSLFRFRKTGCAENQSTVLESFGGINNYSTFDPKGKNVDYEVIEITTMKEEECVYSCLYCDYTIRLRIEAALYDCGHPVHTKCMKEDGCKICKAKLMTSMEFEDLIKKYYENERESNSVGEQLAALDIKCNGELDIKRKGALRIKRSDTLASA